MQSNILPFISPILEGAKHNDDIARAIVEAKLKLGMKLHTVFLSFLSCLLASRLVGNSRQTCTITASALTVSDQTLNEIATDLLDRFANGAVEMTIQEGSEITLSCGAECKVYEYSLLLSKDYCSTMGLNLSGTLTYNREVLAVKFTGEFVNTESSFEERSRMERYDFTLDSGNLAIEKTGLFNI